VSFYVDGVLLGTDTAAPFVTPWNTATAANGGHTIAAAARDAAGNITNSSVAVTVSNAAEPPPGDATPPAIGILSPSSGSSVSGAVSVLVSTSDNIGVVRVDLYMDGALSSTATSAPFTTKWNTRPKGVAKGAHTLQVRAYDAAGNTGDSAVVTVYK
jgi:hypothetical protein